MRTNEKAEEELSGPEEREPPKLVVARLSAKAALEAGNVLSEEEIELAEAEAEAWARRVNSC